MVDENDNAFDRILSNFLHKRIIQAGQEINNQNNEFLNNQRRKDSERDGNDLGTIAPMNDRYRSSNFKKVTKGQGERSSLTQLEKMLILYKEQRGLFLYLILLKT